jgi:RNA polymerase sigma-70 factor (ECF subfamily)
VVVERTLDDLVTAARLGQSDAFALLWRQWSPRVAGYLRGRGVTGVDDVTSEVFLAAFTGLPRFDGDGAAFRSWLFTLAHHKAVDTLRRHRHTQLYEPEDDTRSAPSAEDDAFASLDSADTLAMLAGLTDAQREVLLLRVLADLDVGDVAELTDNTEAGVRQLQKRAVAALRARLAAPSGRTPGHPVLLPRPSAITEVP